MAGHPAGSAVVLGGQLARVDALVGCVVGAQPGIRNGPVGQFHPRGDDGARGSPPAARRRADSARLELADGSASTLARRARSSSDQPSRSRARRSCAAVMSSAPFTDPRPPLLSVAMPRRCRRGGVLANDEGSTFVATPTSFRESCHIMAKLAAYLQQSSARCRYGASTPAAGVAGAGGPLYGPPQHDKTNGECDEGDAGCAGRGCRRAVGVRHAASAPEHDGLRPEEPGKGAQPQYIPPMKAQEKIFPLDSTWTAVSLNGKPFAGADRPSFIIDKQYRARGFGGCNTFAATAFPLKEQHLAVGPLALTKRSCDKASALRDAVPHRAAHLGPVGPRRLAAGDQEPGRRAALRPRPLKAARPRHHPFAACQNGPAHRRAVRACGRPGRNDLPPRSSALRRSHRPARRSGPPPARAAVCPNENSGLRGGTGMRSMSRRVLLAAALLGSGLTGALAQDKTPVKLGAIEILTGRTAATGSRSSAASTSRSPTSTRPAACSAAVRWPSPTRIRPAPRSRRSTPPAS